MRSSRGFNLFERVVYRSPHSREECRQRLQAITARWIDFSDKAGGWVIAHHATLGIRGGRWLHNKLYIDLIGSNVGTLVACRAYLDRFAIVQMAAFASFAAFAFSKYGVSAGVVALMLWVTLGSVRIFYGLAQSRGDPAKLRGRVAELPPHANS